MSIDLMLKLVIVACLVALAALCILVAIFLHVWRGDPAGGQSVKFWRTEIYAIVHDHDAPLSLKLDKIFGLLDSKPTKESPRT